MFQVSLKNGCKIPFFTLRSVIWLTYRFVTWCHFFFLVQKIRQTQLSAVPVWQKQWQFYLLLGKSIRYDCNNLYLHNKPFKITMKPNWYLTSVFPCGLVKLWTLTFTNINLTKAVRNLYVVCHCKEAAIISIYSFRSFIEDQNQIHTWCQYSVVTR